MSQFTKPGTWDGDDFLGLVFVTVILAVIGIVVWIVVMCIRADRRVDYCYVEEQNGVYVVVGHRNWAYDVAMAKELTSPAAHARLVEMCPGGKP